MTAKTYPIQPVCSIEGQMYTLRDGALWNVNAIALPGTMRGTSTCGQSTRAEVIDWRWNEDEFPSGRNVESARHWLRANS